MHQLSEADGERAAWRTARDWCLTAKMEGSHWRPLEVKNEWSQQSQHLQKLEQLAMSLFAGKDAIMIFRENIRPEWED